MNLTDIETKIKFDKELSTIKEYQALIDEQYQMAKLLNDIINKINNFFPDVYEKVCWNNFLTQFDFKLEQKIYKILQFGKVLKIKVNYNNGDHYQFDMELKEFFKNILADKNLELIQKEN